MSRLNEEGENDLVAQQQVGKDQRFFLLQLDKLSVESWESDREGEFSNSLCLFSHFFETEGSGLFQ